MRLLRTKQLREILETLEQSVEAIGKVRLWNNVQQPQRVLHVFTRQSL